MISDVVMCCREIVIVVRFPVLYVVFVQKRCAAFYNSCSPLLSWKSFFKLFGVRNINYYLHFFTNLQNPKILPKKRLFEIDLKLFTWYVKMCLREFKERLTRRMTLWHC